MGKFAIIATMGQADICDLRDIFNSRFPQNAPMFKDERQLKSWIRDELHKKGRGARRDLAAYLGVSQDKITRMLNDGGEKEQRRIEAIELRRICDFLGKIAPLFTIMHMEEDPSSIPVWGLAGAGGVVNNFREGNEPIDTIPRPAGSNERTGSVEITGGSLGKIFDGWYAIYDEIREIPSGHLGRGLYVVETTNDRVYIKGLKRERGGKFTLVSNKGRDIRGVELKWAAPVKSIIPK